MGDLEGLSAIIVAVGHDQFRTLDIVEFNSMCSGEKIVFADLKSLYKKQALIDAGYNVFRL